MTAMVGSGVELARLRVAVPPLRPIPRPERLLVLTAAAGAGLFVALSLALGQRVAWEPMGAAFGVGAGLMSLGICLRAWTPWTRLPATLVALGFFKCFTLAALACAYLRFPLGGGTIDASLAAIDARLGYDWGRAAVALGEWPGAGPLLARVYVSSLPQIAFLAVLLAATRRFATLHRMALCGGISAAATVSLWCVLPSIGPADLTLLPPGLAERLDLQVSEAFGEALRRLANEGIAVIHPRAFTGVIAFPSYHCVMALIVAWYARDTWAAGPFLALSLLMLPATLVHGGHHLVDLLGGLAVFAAAAALAARLAPDAPAPARHEQEGAPRPPGAPLSTLQPLTAPATPCTARSGSPARSGR